MKNNQNIGILAYLYYLIYVASSSIISVGNYTPGTNNFIKQPQICSILYKYTMIICICSLRQDHL